MVKPLNKAQEAGAKAVETLRESGTKGVVAWMDKGAADYDVEAKVEETRAGALRRSEGSLKSDIDQLKQNDQKMFDLVRDVMAAMERCTQIALQTR